MIKSLALIITAFALLLLVCPEAGRAETKPDASDAATAQTSSSIGAIAPGTSITMQNWSRYKEFMPDGMAAFFAGVYPWKMPADIEMIVGPTIIHPLPKGYLDATEKYAAQVKVIDVPDGGLTLTGYQGGIPFPNPDQPHKGWKILANLWYRYLPHLIVDTYSHGCLIDSTGSYSCKTASLVTRQLSYNTDPGVPPTIPGAEGKFSTEWLMVVEPEQDRYTATLTISYADPARPQDSYVFLPALRRFQPISTSARCAPNQGTDSTEEDYRLGYNSDITAAQVEIIGEKKILSLLDYTLPAGDFPNGYYMPLAWPNSSWGKWQLRDVYVIRVSRIPSKAAGYCYGKRVMYVDKATWMPLWEDLYDSKMQLWRIFGLFNRSVDVPGIGPVNSSGSLLWAFWDVQHQHATIFIEPSAGRPFYVNDQAPMEYLDLTRYTTPPGLNLIMR